jgi:hypothetical protein
MWQPVLIVLIVVELDGFEIGSIFSCLSGRLLIANKLWLRKVISKTQVLIFYRLKTILLVLDTFVHFKE